MAQAVLSGFVLALIAPWIYQTTRSVAGWIIALLPLSLTIYFASFIGPVTNGDTFVITAEWVPSLGVNLSFHVDGLSLLFAILISGIGTLIIIYASGYLSGHVHLGRLYAFLLAFMASMLGLVLADNIITLFIFWELTSITSFLLIGFDHARAAAREAASQALVITSAGGLFLLIGFILIGQETNGQWSLSELIHNDNMVRQSSLYTSILILILLGAFTKSAQFPFHFWLPGAMQAPTPVSAYLHSATMVKAGIYLLARLSPILGGTTEWTVIVTAVGLITMLVGAGLALTKTDLKQILAYSTISALGTLVMFIGLDTHYAIKATVVFLIVHSLYKGALFMVAGAIDHETGTRDITQLRGLGQAMPITAISAGLAALSMAGVPGFLGFVGKELLYEADLHAPNLSILLTTLTVVANIAMVAVAAIMGLHVFFGRKTKTPKSAHEAPFRMWLGPITLALIGVVLGILPSLADTFVSSTVSSILAKPTEVHLKVWHGINTALILSVVTIAGGIGLYLVRTPIRTFIAQSGYVPQLSAEKLYRLSLLYFERLSRFLTEIIQSGFLRYYIAIVLITTTLGIGYTLLSRYGIKIEWTFSEMRVYEVAIAIIILLATYRAVNTNGRLTAVAALGVVGYGMALLFTLFGAPDLAMTQFSIETLSVILLVLILYRLPRFSTFANQATRMRDRVIALSAGGLMTLLVLTVTSLQSESRLTPYFAENSYLKAKGQNIVNVILVDFRGLDTMGEITVLAIAAAGVFALLKFPQDGGGES